MTTMDPSDESIRSILIPTDGSSGAREALERAIQLARASDATVHVLTVVDTTTNSIAFGVTEVSELDQAAQQLVADILEVYEKNEIDIRGAVRRGRPVNVILSYAREHDIDCIVVGKTGRGTVKRALLGSTTNRLVRESSIPVVVVPEDD